ncbi:uncharacterized protein LOC131168986 [Hevea brasiliensis]|uniref:uncharacterized protein LOC131168986 n=1 Tax=Hevea brasiliensis TaxID=3981 RepID=UPI0025D7B309|nr:uncharacterized protein LOC131168986 [Hevea brasiliensis]
MRFAFARIRVPFLQLQGLVYGFRVGSVSPSCPLSPPLKSQPFSSTNTRFIAPTRLAQYRSKCVMNRKVLLSKELWLLGFQSWVLLSEPVKGLESLPYKPEGYNYWTWRGHKIHYVVQGEGYNIPELAKRYKVYALDLLGFGWSEKAIIEYDAMVRRDQVVDFLKEIVKEPAVVVGNRNLVSTC